MPGLMIFGRRWMVGSDELVFPFGISFILRVIWMVTVTICVAVAVDFRQSFGNLRDCESQVVIYLIGQILLLLVSVIMDALVVCVSGRGSIFEDHLRKGLAPLLYTRLALYFVELIWLGLSIAWVLVNRHQRNCPNSLDQILAQVIVIFNILFLVGVIITIYMYFDPAGRLWSKFKTSRKTRSSQYGSIDFNDLIRQRYETELDRTCRALFCCTKIESSKDNIFGFISRELSDYFQEYQDKEFDIVPSDVVAGLVLLRKHQKILEAKRVQRLLDEGENNALNNESDDLTKGSVTRYRHQKSENAKPFSFSNKDELKLLSDVTHFFNYAVSIYGWPFYLYGESCGCCSLTSKLSCCTCCKDGKDDSYPILDDNCCRCNLAAVHLFLKGYDTDLIYISYSNEVFETPFFVMLDHKRKAVVLVCRGTLSLKDVLTDCMIELERIPVEDGNSAWMGHKGFIQSAQYVLETLNKEDLLKRAFTYDTDRGTESYRLTIVGHSLGAGTASILAYLLRPKYPDLVCYAYGAVGATFNLEASRDAQDFIYSVVVGKDVIGRLSRYTLEELRHNIIALIKNSRLPKWKILRGCLCQCMLCCQSTAKTSHLEYIECEVADVPVYEVPDTQRFYMGGRVIHIVKTKSIYPRYFGKKQAVYEAVWADVEDFQSIQISTLMWKDHLPDTTMKALLKCLPEDVSTDVDQPRSNQKLSANSDDVFCYEDGQEQERKLLDSSDPADLVNEDANATDIHSQETHLLVNAQHEPESVGEVA